MCDAPRRGLLFVRHETLRPTIGSAGTLRHHGGDTSRLDSFNRRQADAEGLRRSDAAASSPAWRAEHVVELDSAASAGPWSRWERISIRGRGAYLSFERKNSDGAEAASGESLSDQVWTPEKESKDQIFCFAMTRTRGRLF